MRLSLEEFAGIAPKQLAARLSVAYASIAENVDLSRGSIQAWRKPAKISVDSGEALHVRDCCVMTAENCGARFVDYPAHGNAITIATGVLDYPVYSTTCPPQWKRLGFECELNAPAVQVSPAALDFASEQRSYYYTVINELGWESAPSFPSAWQAVKVGQAVRVAGFTVPPEAEKIRIYRAQTPLSFGVEEQQDDALYLLVGEIPRGQALFVDDEVVAGEANSSENDYAPPVDLRELDLWQQAYLVGLSADEFVMSAHMRPHAWLARYRLRLSRPVKALRCGSAFCYLLTDACPTVLQWQGDCEGDSVPFSIHEIPQALPIISRRSAAMHLDAVVYASEEGLVMLRGADAAIISRDYLTAAQWQQWLPHTMRGAVHDGVYYGASDNIFIRFDLPDSIFSHNRDNALTTLSFRPRALAVSNTGNLYLALPDGVYEWNAGTEALPYFWKSKVHDFGGRQKISAFQLDASGQVAVQHYLNGHTIQNINADARPKRLPLGYAGQEWQFSFSGTAEIKHYHLASSVRELAL